MMQRIRIQQPGGYDVLRLETLDTPKPGPGQVLVACQACGVNYADGIIRMGLYASARELHGYPITPGFEVAGTIAAVGEGVDDWQVGDAVIGVTLFNGYASHVVLPAEGVFRKPAQLDFAQAAALPTVFLTAWWMVHRQLHAQAGERWLVHSASGGVGSALLQLARLAGIEAIAVVGASHKVEHAKQLGAAAVIDRSQEDLWARAKALSPEGYHAIFDANGVTTLADSYAHLAPTGRLMIYGFAGMLPKDGRRNWLKLAWHWWRTPRFNPLNMTRDNRSVLAANLSFLQAHAPTLRTGMLWLLDHFETGALQALPVTRFALADADQAQRAIESGQTVGKLILEP